MKRYLSIVIIVVCAAFFQLSAQISIEIIPTNLLSENDELFINKLVTTINQGRGSRKISYSLVISNLYNYSDDKIVIAKSESFNASKLQFETKSNFGFSTKEKLNNEILKSLDEEAFNISYSSKFNFHPSRNLTRISELDILVKTIKKQSKSKEVKIYYDNGFLLPAYSKERLSNFLENENDCESLRPKIRGVKDKYQLRPSSQFYQIEFDSVGYFNAYEVEIYRYVEREKRILFHEIIEIKNKKDSESEYSIEHDSKKRKSIIYLNEKFLGKSCVNIRPANELGIDWEDSDCDCVQECLYDVNFNLRIRGVAEGFTDDCLWTEELKKIEFQCDAKGKK